MSWIKNTLLIVAFIVAGIGIGWAASRLLAPAAQDFEARTIDRAAQSLPTSKPLMLSLSTCPACRKAREWLAANAVDHLEMQIDKSSEAQALADQLGVRAVPVFVIGDQQITGFDPEQLKQLLHPSPGG